jgi:hypothetical protein
LALLDPPMKRKRAERLMDLMIARAEIVHVSTGKTPGLRLASQGNK